MYDDDSNYVTRQKLVINPDDWPNILIRSKYCFINHDKRIAQYQHNIVIEK